VLAVEILRRGPERQHGQHRPHEDLLHGQSTRGETVAWGMMVGANQKPFSGSRSTRPSLRALALADCVGKIRMSSSCSSELIAPMSVFRRAGRRGEAATGAGLSRSDDLVGGFLLHQQSRNHAAADVTLVEEKMPFTMPSTAWSMGR